MRRAGVRELIGWIVFLYLVFYFMGYADVPASYPTSLANLAQNESFENGYARNERSNDCLAK